MTLNVAQLRAIPFSRICNDADTARHRACTSSDADRDYAR